jgi:hypothetical protein
VYKIVSTTDNKYVGIEIDSIPNPVYIYNDFLFYYDKKIEIDNQITLINSNYIINLIKK